MFKKSFYLATTAVLTSLLMTSASYGMLEEDKQSKSIKQPIVEDFLYKPEGHDKLATKHLKIIGADVAHKKNIFGEGVKVAVIDSGWFDRESDTKEALTETTKQRIAQFTPPAKRSREHANMVSSLIAGKQGIAPKVKLEIFTPYGIQQPADKDMQQTYTTWYAQAIRQAVDEGVDFINISMGFDELGENFPQPIEEAFYSARDKGVGVILAAGNDNRNNYIGDRRYPNFNKIVENMNGHLRLAVSTGYRIDHCGKLQETLPYFSTALTSSNWMYGIAAPGENILSCRAGSEEVIWKGTSCSAPIITGSAALVLGYAPHLKGKGAEVFKILDQSARKLELNPDSLEEYRERRQSGWFFSLEYGNYVEPESSLGCFDESLEKDYQDSLRLDVDFGQGVVNIPAALDLVAQ